MSIAKTLTLTELFAIKQNFPVRPTCDDEIWQIVLNPFATNSTGYIAGSAALRCLANLLGQETNWVSNDIDCFIPKMNKNHRHLVNELNLDVVWRNESNIVGVLLDFDLPCCRVAYDPGNLNFYVSYQALLALITGYYYLPEYLRSADELLNKLALNRDKHVKNWRLLFQRFEMRCQKYQNRGFTPIYIAYENMNLPAINQFQRLSGYFSRGSSPTQYPGSVSEDFYQQYKNYTSVRI